MSNNRDLADLGKSAEAIDVDASAPADSLNIDSSGNVGIGTSSPITSLTLGTGTTGVSFKSGNTSFNSGKIAVVKPYEVGSGNGHLIFETYEGGSGGGERMRIDSSGRVTMPYQPGFRSGSWTWAATTGIAYSYATTSGNTGGLSFNYRNSGHFNTSTGRFTAPVSGKYLIQASYADDNSVESRNVGWLYINGANRGEWVESWGQYDNASNCIIEYLTTGDYVEFGRHPGIPYDGVVASVDLLG